MADIYALIYHDGNICVYKNKECLYSDHYAFGHTKSVAGLLNIGHDILYRRILDDEIKLFDINNDVELQQRINEMESILK